jgi:mannan endo-1,4-beta-mannosidase
MIRPFSLIILRFLPTQQCPIQTIDSGSERKLPLCLIAELVVARSNQTIMKISHTLVIILFLCGLSLVSQSHAQSEAKTSSRAEYKPADRKASRQVKAVLNYLLNQRGKGFISGQTDLADAEWIKANTGKYPAILGMDFMHVPKRMGGDVKDTATAIDWYRQKRGLVTFQWHWSSPSGAENPGSGFNTRNTTFDLAAALSDPNSSDYKGLIEDIDDVAAEMKKMSDAHVPILFRPLHEAQGRWFWWGAKGSENCVKLYTIIFDRMTRHHRLHNLIWVWTAYPASQGKGDPAVWYPGDDFVDIIASDYNEKKQDYDDLVRLTAGKKMVALAETMNAPDPSKVLNSTPWVYWVTWARRDWNKRSPDDMKQAIAHPLTITLDRLPDVSKW